MKFCRTVAGKVPWKSLVVPAVVLAVFVLVPTSAFAESPWETAARNLEITFTGPLARSLVLVAIVVGGLTYMFTEHGFQQKIAGIVFGGGMALFAAQFMLWLY